MRDHYYSKSPTSAHDMRRIHTEMKGVTFTFTTDASVFAKRTVDYGTRALIERLPLPLTGSVLDIGCGYGPIGLAVAAMSPQAEVTMVDVNQRALELCRINAVQNRLEGVNIVESDGLTALGGQRFDWVLTNPPIRAGKVVVYRIFEQVREHLHGAGQFWLVINKKQGSPSAVKKLKTLFSEVNIVAKDKGYAIIRCRE